MDHSEQDEAHHHLYHEQPAAPPATVTPATTPATSRHPPPPATARARLRSFILPHAATNMPFHTNGDANANPESRSRLHRHMPSLLRRFTSHRSSTAQSRPHQASTHPSAPDAQPAPPRRSLPFAGLGRSASQRFSYIHQETVTTISDRQEELQELGDARNVAYSALEQDEMADNDHDSRDVGELPRSSSRTSRRHRWSLQMSNFFPSHRSPGNRHVPSSSPLQPRSRLSSHEPIPDLNDPYLRPPTPAEVRMSLSQEHVRDADEAEYERISIPTRRRLRPLPLVGEPHDEDYVRRRRERRATWGPNPLSLRESPMESLQAAPRPPVELPTPSTTGLGYDLRPTLAPSSRTPSIFSRAFSGSSNSDLPEPAHLSLPPHSRQAQPPASSPIGSRPTNLLRHMLARRRSSNNADSAPSSPIPLAELRRLLASYATQSSDRDYNGHQETTVDGGTITIYGIRRVNARASSDNDDGNLFPPPDPSGTPSEERLPLMRDPPRGPRRIFNFIGPGLSEFDPLPPEFEQTFERLRRGNRRPRSMFGSGAVRRHGMVEPDVPNTAESSTHTSEDTNQAPDSDETWIFYIVSAVLPEDHPLLSAPSLFTDNPTYEDMLFLDSFLQKPVASRADVASARGLYNIHRRSNGDLYASGQEEVEDTIEITTERCLICLSDFEEKEEARRLVKCAHFFHKECIDTWLTEGRNSCPLCRGQGVEKKRSSRHMGAGPSTAPTSSLDVL